MTCSVRLWESELRSRELPSVCVVTGEDAVMWMTCSYDYQRGHDGAPDTWSTAHLPVCRRIRRGIQIQEGCLVGGILAWLGLMVAGFVLGAGFGNIWGVWLIFIGFGLVPLVAVGAAIVAPRLPQTPSVSVAGTDGAERWVVVGPVHPYFAAAVSRLPRPRPSH